MVPKESKRFKKIPKVLLSMAKKDVYCVNFHTLQKIDQSLLLEKNSEFPECIVNHTLCKIISILNLRLATFQCPTSSCYPVRVQRSLWKASIQKQWDQGSR